MKKQFYFLKGVLGMGALLLCSSGWASGVREDEDPNQKKSPQVLNAEASAMAASAANAKYIGRNFYVFRDGNWVQANHLEPAHKKGKFVGNDYFISVDGRWVRANHLDPIKAQIEREQEKAEQEKERAQYAKVQAELKEVHARLYAQELERKKKRNGRVNSYSKYSAGKYYLKKEGKWILAEESDPEQVIDLLFGRQLMSKPAYQQALAEIRSIQKTSQDELYPGYSISVLGDRFAYTGNDWESHDGLSVEFWLEVRHPKKPEQTPKPVVEKREKKSKKDRIAELEQKVAELESKNQPWKEGEGRWVEGKYFVYKDGQLIQADHLAPSAKAGAGMEKRYVSKGIWPFRSTVVEVNKPGEGWVEADHLK